MIFMNRNVVNNITTIIIYGGRVAVLKNGLYFVRYSPYFFLSRSILSDFQKELEDSDGFRFVLNFNIIVLCLHIILLFALLYYYY